MASRPTAPPASRARAAASSPRASRARATSGRSGERIVGRRHHQRPAPAPRAGPCRRASCQAAPVGPASSRARHLRGSGAVPQIRTGAQSAPTIADASDTCTRRPHPRSSEPVARRPAVAPSSPAPGTYSPGCRRATVRDNAGRRKEVCLACMLVRARRRLRRRACRRRDRARPAGSVAAWRVRSGVAARWCSGRLISGGTC